jgi:hypothetical protein
LGAETGSCISVSVVADVVLVFCTNGPSWAIMTIAEQRPVFNRLIYFNKTIDIPITGNHYSSNTLLLFFLPYLKLYLQFHCYYEGFPNVFEK